jgi:hypothetical protein
MPERRWRTARPPVEVRLDADFVEVRWRGESFFLLEAQPRSAPAERPEPSAGLHGSSRNKDSDAPHTTAPNANGDEGNPSVPISRPPPPPPPPSNKPNVVLFVIDALSRRQAQWVLPSTMSWLLRQQTSQDPQAPRVFGFNHFSSAAHFTAGSMVPLLYGHPYTADMDVERVRTRRYGLHARGAGCLTRTRARARRLLNPGSPVNNVVRAARERGYATVYGHECQSLYMGCNWCDGRGCSCGERTRMMS